MSQKEATKQVLKNFITSEFFFGISVALTLTGIFCLLGWLMIEVIPRF